jgi:hypothetical protein
LNPTIIQNMGLRGCHSRFHWIVIASPWLVGAAAA